MFLRRETRERQGAGQVVSLIRRRISWRECRLSSTSHAANQIAARQSPRTGPLVTSIPAMTTCMWYVTNEIGTPDPN